MTQEELLKRIKDLLREAHGERLQGLVLFGSEARGESGLESDIDLLVLLKGPVELWKDIRKNVAAVYDLQLEIERPIHAMPTDAEEFWAGKFSLYRTVQKEGIFA